MAAPSPQNAAGTDGNAGLEELVSGAPRVIVRVDEAGEASLLVGLEALAAGPCADEEDAGGGDEDEGLAETDTAEEEPGDEDGACR